MSAPDVVVEAVGLTKVFRDFWGRPRARAVDGIDFTLRRGEVTGLLGPNGSGKSTTVKMLLGLLYPTSGIVRVFGSSPRDVATKKLIGYLPEESYLYRYLTAEETLDFFGSLFGLSKSDRRDRTAQLLKMVGLDHARKRRIGEFSKGMTRRIGIAQAMINDPDLLILDEPTSGLDPIGCREVKDLILKLRERHKTVLVTSHLLGDVEDVCDKAMILYGGTIRAQGRLDDLLTRSEDVSVTLGGLDDAGIGKLTEWMKTNLPGARPEFGHPRRSLEELFLDVVERARVERRATSGAESGSGVAEYLDGKNEVLEGLLAEKTSERISEADATKPAAANPASDDDIDDIVREPSASAIGPVPAEPAPDESEIAGRLDKLLGEAGKDTEK